MSYHFTNEPESQNGSEKSPLSGYSSHGGIASTTWMGSGLGDCLSGIGMSCPPCPPCGPQYAQWPDSYVYERPALGNDPSFAPGPHDHAFHPTPMMTSSPQISAHEHTVMVTPYLPSYPVLQPTRVVGAQSTTMGENVGYPANQPGQDYFMGAGQDRNPAGLTPSNLIASFATISSVYGTFEHEVNHGPTAKAKQRALETANSSSDEDHDGVLLVPSTPVRTVGRRGPFKDEAMRLMTAHTRKLGSCIRCRMQRIRCYPDPESDSDVCLSCKRLACNANGLRIACIRWKIIDIRLYKPGQVKGHEWTNRWRDNASDDIGTWEGPEIRRIEVTEGYTKKSIKLDVRRFRPCPGDKTARSWVTNGVKKEREIPPWAIADMQKIKAALKRYIKEGFEECCSSVLGSRDPLLSRTYAMAMRASMNPATPEKERELLESTLDLWMSVRLTTKSFEIVGPDTLDMPKNIIAEKDAPDHGKVPLPPVMGAQLDSVLIHQIQADLRHQTLQRLQQMTNSNKPQTWLTTYLVTFILLHNLSLVTAHDGEYAKKHSMGRRFAREAEVKEYNNGANTLLAHFHYCNKNTFPFSDSCKDQDLTNLAQLDEHGRNFVKFTRQLATQQKTQWEGLWENDHYENKHYYLSQLFEEEWQIRHMQ